MPLGSGLLTEIIQLPVPNHRTTIIIYVSLEVSHSGAEAIDLHNNEYYLLIKYYPASAAAAH